MAVSIPRSRGSRPPSLPTLLPRMRDHGRSPESPRRLLLQPKILPTQPCVPTGPRPGDRRQACGGQAPPLAFFLRRASSRSSQQQGRPQPCCKVLTHTEHSLSPRTLLAPSSSCADILIVLLWELAGSLSSGMARRGARAGCWLWLLPREAAHSDRLSNNLNLVRRACGTPAGPLYLLH